MKSWHKHSESWNKLHSPFRPAPSDVAHYRSLIGEGRVMMMGVTPELHAAFTDITAFDRDEAMIAKIWPGNTLTRKVIKADWLRIEYFRSPGFDAVLGDCALPMLGDLDRMRLFQSRCYDWLKPGGVFVQRLMERPATPYTRADLLDIMSRPAKINFHAFKWMLCMVIAAESGYVVRDTDRLVLFNELCSDRDALCAATGWNRDAVDTMDLYAGGEYAVAFCSREEILSTIPEGAADIQFVNMTDYDLAENCPIMSWKKR